MRTVSVFIAVFGAAMGLIAASTQLSLADVPLKGSFLANKECPAFQSFRRAPIQMEHKSNLVTLTNCWQRTPRSQLTTEFGSKMLHHPNVGCVLTAGFFGRRMPAHKVLDRLPALQPRTRLSSCYRSVGSLAFVRATTPNQNAQVKGQTNSTPPTLRYMDSGHSHVNENTAMYLWN